MTIGAVLESLKADFPDLTISKIRFLEAEGLVTPERTASGYRTYSEQDVERLRYVLTAQRDRFWPLKVIREALDALDRGLTPAGATPETVRPQPPRPAARPRRAVRRVADPRSTAAADPRRAARRPSSTAPPSRRWRPSACSVRTRRVTTARPRWPSRTPLPASRHTASSPATCGPSAPPPTARSAWSSRSSRPTAAQAWTHARKADPTAEILRLCIALHAALVKDGLSQA